MTEDEPIDFFIYADQDAFYDALGPGTRENVGGQANAEIRTLFALDHAVGHRRSAGSTIVVPHELVHLVFDTAVDNPYHFPPRWLNEGLAVYLSEGYDAGDRSAVESAARAGTLIPLDGLAGQFPTGDGFFLAYAESVSAVDFFVRTHDQDALVGLIGSYADGLTDDEAFEAAIGMDTAAFNDAWLADLGAVVPERHGPQPAPPGSRPSAWGAPASARRHDHARRSPAPVASAAARARAATRRRPLGGDATLVLVVVAVARLRRRRPARRVASRARPRAGPARRAVTVGARLRAIPSWQVTLGVALLGLGFLVAAQLAAEGPRVRYTTQERSPLVETAQRPPGRPGGAQDVHPRPAQRGSRPPSRRARARRRSSATSTTSSRRRGSRPASSR